MSIDDLSIEALREWLADWLLCDEAAGEWVPGEVGGTSLKVTDNFDAVTFIDECDNGWWELRDELLAAYAGKQEARCG